MELYHTIHHLFIKGTTFENVCFRFENGKIVEATSNNTERLNEILNTDDGARHIGEFAIGVNPYILKPMKDTLFDEKLLEVFTLLQDKHIN